MRYGTPEYERRMEEHRGWANAILAAQYAELGEEPLAQAAAMSPATWQTVLVEGVPAWMAEMPVVLSRRLPEGIIYTWLLSEVGERLADLERQGRSRLAGAEEDDDDAGQAVL